MHIKTCAIKNIRVGCLNSIVDFHSLLFSAGKYDTTPSMNGNAGTGWLNFAFDDGMHVREQR